MPNFPFLAGALTLALVPLLPLPSAAQEPSQGRYIPSADQHVLSQRERPAVVNRLLRDRLDRLLPTLMREAGLDMWLVINREYMEDPVYLTLVPEPVFAARRTTILVFFDRGGDKGVERVTVSRYPIAGFYDSVWEGGDLAGQWRRLAEVIAERNPKRIGINVSRDWAFGDGLSAGLRETLEAALPATLRSRLTGAEELAIRWLETRTAMELEIYPQIVAIARGVISEAFSSRVITPGVTTTDDVAWYIRQRYADLDLPIWFMPSVDLQRPGTTCAADTAFCGESGVIERGDVLHTDVGITYLRLNTDTQEMGYVLKAGESVVPEGLKRALAAGNRWQDIVTGAYASGRTGNEVLALVDKAARAEGLVHNTYSHPIGYFGHAPGPAVGMWDLPADVPVVGERRLYPNTAHSIEGNVKVALPEWKGQHVQIKLEQSAVFDGERVIYLAGRQTAWHVVH